MLQFERNFSSPYMFLPPPVSIKDLYKQVPAALGIAVREIYGPSSSICSAICPCGCDIFTIEIEDGIVSLVCILCGYRKIIFNPHRHGARALMHGTVIDGAEGVHEYACPVCGNNAARTIHIFAYPAQTEMQQMLLEIGDKPENLFIQYTLRAECSSCATPHEAFSVQC
jgi:hypothetical protein